MKNRANQTTYEQWLNDYFPHVASKPLSDRHHRLWRWFESLEVGKRIVPHVEVWPRGGAKSSTAELGVARVGCKLSRRYVLYVSETQDQADKHVAAVSTLLERAGLDRSLNKYGNSKGWRRNQLRASNGFNLESLGLDTAARGIKLDEFRPDLIIFDDIDNREDGSKATEKKIRSLTNSIIPSGSTDCSILFIQNMIIDNGIVARLVKGEADFLLDREVCDVEPAVRNLKYEMQTQSNGLKIPIITGGEATWSGQDLETCQNQMRTWGVEAFLRESQHEVENADGIYFKAREFQRHASIESLPSPIKRIGIGTDIAATEGGGDYTVAVAIAELLNGQWCVLDVLRKQLGTDDVKSEISAFSQRIKDQYGITIDGELQANIPVCLYIPQDPGAAGKIFTRSFVQELTRQNFEARSFVVTKRKAIVAKSWQAVVNAGNAHIIDDEGWTNEYIKEHRDFREDESHLHDDQIDGTSGAINMMIGKLNPFANFTGKL